MEMPHYKDNVWLHEASFIIRTRLHETSLTVGVIVHADARVCSQSQCLTLLPQNPGA